MLPFEKNSRIVFCGDSVTDVNRDYKAIPAGWGSFGDGYVNLVHALLTAVYPDRELMIMNEGVSGDDIKLMAARWDRDVLDMKPDYVSVMIGINDVWRHFDGPFRQADLVSLDEFEHTYEDLMGRTEPRVKGLIVMSPFMIEPKRDDLMRAMVDRYADVARQVADRHGATYVDVQAAMDHFLEKQSSYILSMDRCHPGIEGHMLVARTWLQAVGFDWGRPTFDDEK